MANAKLKPYYEIIQGIRVKPLSQPKHFKDVMNYKPTSDDIFIVTYPKCGTTWMQNIALYIFRKGKELEDKRDFFKMCPFIERTGYQSILNMPRPGAFKTHLSYNNMPYSSEAKYIFVLRNPKDCCVSFYYHTKRDVFKYSEGIFDDFFDLFMAGEVEYNDYFDHLASWYPHRHDKQLFYTTYEDMKEDLKNVVLRLATFLGQEYIEAIEKDSNILNNILKFTGFEYLKSHLAESDGDDDGKDQSKINASVASLTLNNWKFGKVHFRKGVVGDWKNYFSREQSEIMDQKFFERFGETEIYEKYKYYM